MPKTNKKLSIKDKALIAIEYIAMSEDRDNDKEFNMIYRFSHVANGLCEHHNDWKQELDKFIDALKEAGEINSFIN